MNDKNIDNIMKAANSTTKTTKSATVGTTTTADYTQDANTTSKKNDALNKLKYEIASQVGVNLKQGYNGDLPSSRAGKIGGNMVKKLIQDAENSMK